jgi:hypothetical protein
MEQQGYQLRSRGVNRTARISVEEQGLNGTARISAEEQGCKQNIKDIS